MPLGMLICVLFAPTDRYINGSFRASLVDRFDLLTLLFFVYSQSLYDFPDPSARLDAFLAEANEMLDACGMGQIYYANPYETFLLLCLSSELPLCTYADVWELSYGAALTDKG